MKRTSLVDSLLVLLLSTILIWPLFRLKYMDNWQSIESTFISDARMLGDQLPHPGWQPLWYCGTRFDYIYPPALRYGPALLAKAAHLTTARSYHLYTAILYIFGILAVYWLVRLGTASRTAALFATAATALLSPSLLLVRQLHLDSPFWIPQRLHVLMVYGEGPHISALAVLPAALAASWVALRQWKPAALAIAGVLCALVVSHNFYGATALAIFFPILAWSVWTGELRSGVWLRATAIALIAYGICSPWLTPSYLRLTLTNMQWVSHPGNSWSVYVTVAAVILYCSLSLYFGRNKPERTWTIFVAGSLVFFAMDVLGVYYFDFRLIGEGHRLAPELDLAIILAGVEILRYGWNKPSLRIAVAAVALVSFSPAAAYLRHAWLPFPKFGSVESAYPWKIANWVHENLPGQRLMPSGEVRFWFDAWSDNAQMDGGSLQGMLNQIIPVATWQIFVGDRPAPGILWMQALGTDAIIVPGRRSPEHYRADYKFPEKFRASLPLLHEDMDTAIYRVPRLHPNIGRVVDRAAIAAVGPVRSGDDVETLTRYLSIVDEKSQPETTVTWRGFDEVQIRATVRTGQSVLLQETYDSAWHAFENGEELAVRREPVIGFSLIDVPAGDHTITMKFRTPPENQAGFGLFGLSLLSAAGLIASGLRKRLRP